MAAPDAAPAPVTIKSATGEKKKIPKDATADLYAQHAPKTPPLSTENAKPDQKRSEIWRRTSPEGILEARERRSAQFLRASGRDLLRREHRAARLADDHVIFFDFWRAPAFNLLIGEAPLPCAIR